MLWNLKNKQEIELIHFIFGKYLFIARNIKINLLPIYYLGNAFEKLIKMANITFNKNT